MFKLNINTSTDASSVQIVLNINIGTEISSAHVLFNDMFQFQIYGSTYST